MTCRGFVLAATVAAVLLQPGAAAGDGLGLAIVRDVAELYGGGVDLDDSPLGGLRATLDLPAERPEHP